MRLAVRLVAVFVAGVGVLTVAPVAAGAASGTDPRDARHASFDIAKTFVRPKTEPNGVRVLAIGVRTYHSFRLRDRVGSFSIVIDSRGNDRPDLLVRIRGSRGGGAVGLVRSLRSSFEHSVVVHKDSPKQARVVIPRDWAEPNKPIRWHAMAWVGATVNDRAPDRGTYG
jgi:hypothetical protein